MMPDEIARVRAEQERPGEEGLKKKLGNYRQPRMRRPNLGKHHCELKGHQQRVLVVASATVDIPVISTTMRTRSSRTISSVIGTDPISKPPWEA
jgi:hypothetical protein